ncbi:MAG: hypothetical protein MSG64_04070 [Pyrinomonadaceae bacterium MAG19_C2-C3]|nr:hypothetical protein [Pyrinomonadaceae bacterium MAG19_C2-C3]
MEFYTCQIEWSKGKTSYIWVYWTWASHIGEALNKMLNCAKLNGVAKPIAARIDPYDFENLPETAITEDEGDTYFDDEKISFPTEPSYNLPYGVIHSFLDGEYEIDEIKPGYQIDEDDNGLIEVEAVVNETDLLKIYLELVAVLPEIEVFWIKIHDDWEDVGAEEIYVNEEINSRQKIQSFITRHKQDTLLNGHVTITTYSDEGSTNLNISDHKIIVAMTYDKGLSNKICEVFERRGLEKKDKLISVVYGFHHWHYRHPEGLDRQSLIKKLKERGFDFWQPDDYSSV